MSGAPYGYRYIRKTDEVPAAYLVDEAEAGVVRRVYEMYTVEGLSIGEITRRLNTEGVPARKASRWERSVVWGVLRNPAYRGVPPASARPAFLRAHGLCAHSVGGVQLRPASRPATNAPAKSGSRSPCPPW